MQFIDLSRQLERIRPSVDARMNTVLSHGRYILGPEVQELEERLASWVGAKHCIGVANGTDALQLSLMALGVGPGDEVITPSFSYIAAAEVIMLLGATPVLVDIDPETYNIDPRSIETAMTPATKAIIPVDLFGQCADYEAITEIASERGISVIEDGAQSFGASRGGKAACSFGNIATTSFFPSKPLGCYGDGGACFTDDDGLAALLRSMRAHGQAERYHHVRLGVNARLDTLQAAVLLAKLEIFQDEVALRQRAATHYSQLILGNDLAERGVVVPNLASPNTSVWAQYTIRVPNRERVLANLAKRGIPTAVHYPMALHQQRVFASLETSQADLSESTAAASQVMSLPMHPYLEPSEQELVVEALAAAVEEAAE